MSLSPPRKSAPAFHLSSALALAAAMALPMAATAGTQSFSYSGSPLAIPDNNVAGVTANVPVSGITGSITRVTLSIDGSACSSAEGSTTVGLSHGWVGDLVLTLNAPNSTSVVVIDRIGLPDGAPPALATAATISVKSFWPTTLHGP